MALPAENLHPPMLSVNAALRRTDPSRTLFLRNRFARDFRVRFAKLKAVIRKAIVEQDVFGLNPPDAGIRRIMVQETALQIPAREAFAFTRSAEKVEKFMEWLHAQVDRGILEVSERPQIGQAVEGQWQNLYIQDSYQRGVQRARYELAHAGYGVPSMEATGGVMASISLPFHMDRVGLLFTRTYGDLKGITQAMESQISRVLSQGMADGDGPRVLARKLIATIDGRGAGTLGIHDTLGRFIPATQRAEMLARTEIIRSFSEAQLQEFKTWGVVGVNVLAEFVNAGYNVCPICLALTIKYKDGISIDKASGIIPVHPNCRCCWIPREATS